MKIQIESEIAKSLRSLASSMIDQWFGPPLQIGMVTEHPDGRTVKIHDGYFLDPTYGRLSNFWWWREVFPDGSISLIEESGYGWPAEEA